MQSNKQFYKDLVQIDQISMLVLTCKENNQTFDQMSIESM